jgi:hypothetical protein
MTSSRDWEVYGLPLELVVGAPMLNLEKAISTAVARLLGEILSSAAVVVSSSLRPSATPVPARDRFCGSPWFYESLPSSSVCCLFLESVSDSSFLNNLGWLLDSDVILMFNFAMKIPLCLLPPVACVRILPLLPLVLFRSGIMELLYVTAVRAAVWESLWLES